MGLLGTWGTGWFPCRLLEPRAALRQGSELCPSLLCSFGAGVQLCQVTKAPFPPNFIFRCLQKHGRKSSNSLICHLALIVTHLKSLF